MSFHSYVSLPEGMEKPGEKYGKIWENRWNQAENLERFRDFTMIQP